MSRTNRRKNTQWNIPKPYELEWEIDKYGKKFLNTIYYSKDSIKYKKAISYYHSDKKLYGSGVPGWFVNLYCERKLRNETKQAIE